MKSACLDTHSLVWYLSRPKRLGRSALRCLREADAGRVRILIPAAVLVELVLLEEAGRNVIGPAQVEALRSARPNFEVLAMDLRQALELTLLRALKDPFDRMIVSAARVAGVPLLSADERIEASGLVETLWS